MSREEQLMRETGPLGGGPVDDHPMVRLSLKVALSTAPDVMGGGVAADGEGARSVGLRPVFLVRFAPESVETCGFAKKIGGWGGPPGAPPQEWRGNGDRGVARS